MTSPVKIWRNQKMLASYIGVAGRIVTWTMIRVPPEGFSDQAPYPVAVVRLDDGRMITAQIVDCVSCVPSIGDRVVCVVRRISEPATDGVIPYGIKVRFV